MPTMLDKVSPATRDLPRGGLISIPEAAVLIGVSEVTIYRWVKKGSIVFVTLGGVNLIPTMEIEPARKMLQENIKNREETLKRGRPKRKTNQPAATQTG